MQEMQPEEPSAEPLDAIAEETDVRNEQEQDQELPAAMEGTEEVRELEMFTGCRWEPSFLQHMKQSFGILTHLCNSLTSMQS